MPALEVDKSQVGGPLRFLSEIDILRKLKKRFGAKTIPHIVSGLVNVAIAGDSVGFPRRRIKVLLSFEKLNPQDTSVETKPDLQLEIAHVLLIDVVGYSKLCS